MTALRAVRNRCSLEYLLVSIENRARLDEGLTMMRRGIKTARKSSSMVRRIFSYSYLYFGWVG